MGVDNINFFFEQNVLKKTLKEISWYEEKENNIFVKKQLVNSNSETFDFDEINKDPNSLTEDQFYDLVKTTILRLETDENLKVYDFIVIDEAQDILDRGLDLFINKFSGFNGTFNICPMPKPLSMESLLKEAISLGLMK